MEYVDPVVGKVLAVAMESVMVAKKATEANFTLLTITKAWVVENGLVHHSGWQPETWVQCYLCKQS